MSDRTFKLMPKGTSPMRGSDIKAWERELKELFNGIGIAAPIVDNGVYGAVDRSYTRSFAYAVGKDHVEILENGIEPKDRSELRNWRKNQTRAEAQRMKDRTDWRRKLRKRYAQLSAENKTNVSTMVSKLITDKWGWAPPVHDGIDLITLPDVPIFAPVRLKIFDVRSGGWWRKGAPSAAVAAKGDGIVQGTVLETVGPFKRGYHLGFGHMEKAKVRIGQTVDAGDELGHSGLANAWHIHWMLNSGNTKLGIGTLNPRACLDYTKKHG